MSPSSTRRRVALPLATQLEAHGSALSRCRRCESAAEGALPILSEARAPRVMLVGQAPGKSEIVDRRPFAGRAGKTLFTWLAQIGLDERRVRERIYIAAITRCYPGPSPSGRGDRVPSPRERALCGSWLEDELAIIRPAVIIPVGRLAIDRFLGAAPLDQIIGRAHEISVSTKGSTIASTAIPLPHPSGASSWIHERGHRALLDRALELLRDRLGTTGVYDEPIEGVAAPSARSVA